jgi:hypothetical protein
MLVAAVSGCGAVEGDSLAPTLPRSDARNQGRQAATTPEFVPGELIVGFHHGVTSADIQGWLASQKGLHGVRAKANLKPTAFESIAPAVRSVVVPANATLAMIDVLERHPLVRFAEPNYYLYADAIPNDPQFDQLWAMHNTGQTGGTADADIDGPESWDRIQDASSVVVGIIDTGVNYRHEDLMANIWTNPNEIAGNGVDDDGNGYVDDMHGINAVTDSGDPMDDQGHGSHCAGTIGGRGNNGVGVAGVAWKVQIVGCKFLNAGGNGTTEDAIQCFEYFNALRYQYGINVLVTNNSWGGGAFSQALHEAMVGPSPENPILHVCAAGNTNSNNDFRQHYPSNYPIDNIVAVAATDHNDNYANFSNYGATSVDLAAPGVDILSAWSPGNSYHTMSGTSMAAPHVAGAAALVFAENASYDASQVKDWLLFAGEPLADPNKQTLTNGRLKLREPCLPIPVADAGPDQIDCLGDTVMIGTPGQPRTTYSWSPGGQTTPQITVSPTQTTTYTLTATSACGSAQDSVTILVDDGTLAGLSEDFEGGTNGWTADGLWHAAVSSSCARPGYSSPVTAMYYGQDATCTFDTGGANSGNLTSPMIYGIGTASTLTFNYFRQVQSYYAAFDVTQVNVLAGGSSTTVWMRNAFDASQASWLSSGTIDLSAFAGQAIQLQFRFATVDSMYNDYVGWLIDDVVVTGTSSCGGGNQSR